MARRNRGKDVFSRLEARRNLAKAGNRVDYVITHCCCTHLQAELCARLKPESACQPDILTEFFEELEERLTYQAWYFGHLHRDIRVDEKHFLMYEGFEILRASDFKL